MNILQQYNMYQAQHYHHLHVSLSYFIVILWIFLQKILFSSSSLLVTVYKQINNPILLFAYQITAN